MYHLEKWISFFIAIGMSLSLQGQMVLSSAAILNSARHDRAVNLQSQHIDFINEHQHGLPFAEQFSFRTESDRFLVDRQEYLARLTVNDFSEMHRTRQWQQATVAREESIQRVYLHDALAERYFTIADYVNTLNQWSVQKQILLVYDDQVKVYNKMAALNANVDVDDLIRAEYDRDELALKIAETQSRSGQLEIQIKEWVPEAGSDFHFDTAGFIGIDQIKVLMDQIPGSGEGNPMVVEKQFKLQEIDAEYALEKANGRQVLDFFQLRYANRPDNDFTREYSVGFGINLPYRGSSLVKLGEIKIEKDNIDQNLQLNLETLSQSIRGAKEKIQSLLTRYAIAKEQWEQSQGRYSLEESTSGRADGPLMLLKARELQLKRELTLLDIEHDIREQYLNVLDWSGNLSAEPAINYLSRNLEEF